MDIIYSNPSIRLTDFWNWLGELRSPNPGESTLHTFLLRLEEPNREEIIVTNFWNLLNILISIRRGVANPIGLRVRLKRRIYLVDPQGNLFLEKPNRLRLRTIKLDDMLARIRKA